MDEGPAQSIGSLVKALVDPLEDRLVSDPWPADAQPIVFKRHPARTVVVCHHQISLRLMHRAVVWSLDPRCKPPQTLTKLVRDARFRIAANQVCGHRKRPRKKSRNGSRR